MKYLALALLLAGCVNILDLPDYICMNGFKWTINGEPIVNAEGHQLSCTPVQQN